LLETTIPSLTFRVLRLFASMPTLNLL